MENVTLVFGEVDCKNSSHIPSEKITTTPNLKVYLNEKAISGCGENRIITSESNWIIIIGTYAYDKNDQESSIRIIYEKLLSDTFQSENILGHFCIYFCFEKTLKIIYDAGSYLAPYILEEKVITSNFLVACDLAKTLSINKTHLIVNILTGLNIKPETTFNEIQVLSPGQYNLDIGFTLMVEKARVIINKDSKYHEGLILDIEIDFLHNLINSFSGYYNKYICDLGLSSGYDSRLLLGLLNKNRINVQLHTYWKAKKDFDISIAEELSKVISKELIQVPIIESSKKNNIDFLDLLYKAMTYYNGVFVSNHGWVRDYRTTEHRIKILGNAKLGLSGISGEQYRNDQHWPNYKVSRTYLFKNFLFENDNYKVFNDLKSEIKKSVIKFLESNIGQIGNNTSISKKVFYEIFCETWVPYGPGYRNKMENQIAFFWSPFTERVAQIHAYKLVSKLGVDGQFQARMIKQISPDLASIQSDYGFNFLRIPFRRIVQSSIQSIFGKSRVKKALQFANSESDNSYLKSFGKNEFVVMEILDELKNYNIGIPIINTRYHSDTYDRLIAAGYLIKYYKSKVIC